MAADENRIIFHKNLENCTVKSYGHVERITEQRWPKNIFNWSVNGKQGRVKNVKHKRILWKRKI